MVKYALMWLHEHKYYYVPFVFSELSRNKTISSYSAASWKERTHCDNINWVLALATAICAFMSTYHKIWFWSGMTALRIIRVKSSLSTHICSQLFIQARDWLFLLLELEEYREAAHTKKSLNLKNFYHLKSISDEMNKFEILNCTLVDHWDF